MSIDTTKEQRLKIWEELISVGQQRVLPIQEGEMTIQMFAEKSGYSATSASRILRLLVEEGKFTKRDCIMNGKKVQVFSPITGQP